MMQAKLSSDTRRASYRRLEGAVDHRGAGGTPARGNLEVVRLAVFTLVFVLLPATAAWAHDNGEGLLGETNDKVVTFFSLGVIVFFALVVILGTAIQTRLEKRKDAQKALDLRRRVGW